MFDFISVIVPTYNRSYKITKTLDSLKFQEYKNFEVIIVDDGSTDDTKKNVLNFISENKLNNFKYIYKENGGSGSARNIGIKSSKSSIIMFTDDDCVVPKNWISNYVIFLNKNPEVNAVSGWYENKLLEDRFSDILKLETEYSFPGYRYKKIISNSSENICFGNTGNLACRRELFDKIGYFNEDIPVSVDWEFRQRVFNYKLTVATLPIVIHHNKEFTLFSFLKRSFKYGFYRKNFIRMYPYISQPNFLSLEIQIKNIILFAKVFGFKCGKLLLVSQKLSFVFGYYTFVLISFFNRSLNKNLNKNYSYVSDFDEEFRIEEFEDKTYKKRYLKIDSVFTLGLYEKLSFKYKNSSLESAPLVSIVIPVFNRANNIKSVLDCIYNQRIHNSWYEIIIVDDGSSDGLEESVKEYVSVNKISNLNFVRKENGGASSARNLGIKESLGKYIYFTDSDVNMVNKHTLSTFLVLFDMYPDLICVGGGQRTYKKDLLSLSLFNNYRNSFKWNQEYKYLKLSNLIDDNIIHPLDTANIMYKKDVFNLVGTFDENFGTSYEDTDLACRVKKQGLTSVWIPIFVENTSFVSNYDLVNKIQNRMVGHKQLIKKYSEDKWLKYNFHQNYKLYFSYILRILFSPSKNKFYIIKIIQNLNMK